MRAHHRTLLAASPAPADLRRFDRKLLGRVFRYAAPHGGRIAGILLLILVGAGLNLVQPLILRDLIDRTIPAGDLGRLGLLGLALLAVPVLGGGVNVARRRLSAAVGEGVIHELRVGLFGHLQRMSLRFFTHTEVGELMSRLNTDVVGAHTAVSITLVEIATNLVQAGAILAVMAALEWRLAILSVAVLPLYFAVARPMGRRLRAATRGQMEANARMSAMMSETLSVGGALLVKLFGRRDDEVTRFRQRAARVRDLGVRRAVLGSTSLMIVGLVGAVGTALIYTIGGYLAIRGTFTVGTIVAFSAYLTTLYGALRGLANSPVEFAASVVSFERVFEVLDLPAEVDDRPGAVALERVTGEIVFDRVSFRYDADRGSSLRAVRRYGKHVDVGPVFSEGKAQGAPADPAARPERALREADDGPFPPPSQAREVALRDVSFRAAPGQLVALVGPSGAGKTTLTYLIPRLYDVTSGAVRIDGHDVRDVTLESLAGQVGVVTQDIHLFHDTIRTNLLYARPDAGPADLEAAARAANLHAFVAALPEGYETVVGERGYRLSGGEKQRLALARVILKDPRILILDEATSHLDSESEALIQETLRHLMAGRTSIVIAHRLSTVLAADQILVLDRGEIVERGTHPELLARGGLYAGLYHTQFDEGRTSNG